MPPKMNDEDALSKIRRRTDAGEGPAQEDEFEHDRDAAEEDTR
jgi:hypothetical protein